MNEKWAFALVLSKVRQHLDFTQIQEIADAADMKIPALEELFEDAAQFAAKGVQQ